MKLRIGRLEISWESRRERAEQCAEAAWEARQPRCESLKEHPGRWVRVGSWDSPGAAYTAASALRKHGFEVRTSRSSDGPGAFLYARWPESAAARKVG